MFCHFTFPLNHYGYLEEGINYVPFSFRKYVLSVPYATG